MFWWIEHIKNYIRLLASIHYGRLLHLPPVLTFTINVLIQYFSIYWVTLNIVVYKIIPYSMVVWLTFMKFSGYAGLQLNERNKKIGTLEAINVCVAGYTTFFVTLYGNGIKSIRILVLSFLPTNFQPNQFSHSWVINKMYI